MGRKDETKKRNSFDIIMMSNYLLQLKYTYQMQLIKLQSELRNLENNNY